MGLGNPGPKYAQTRHNIGFKVVEYFAVGCSSGRWIERELYSEFPARVGKNDIVLVRPSAFMNRSGEAVMNLLRHYQAEPPEMLVVVDDIDLPLGRIRLRPRGGPGTHNGLRDICSSLGDGFPRLRLGIRGEKPWSDLAQFVLSPFSSTEEAIVGEVVSRASAIVGDVLGEGVQSAMNEANRSAAEDSW